MKLNPLLYLLYQGAKIIVRLVLWIFYPTKEVQHKERLSIRGPAIVVTNHPNTLIDPFVAASMIWQPVFFLANASLFKNWFTNWFFSTFYCIPIERALDTGGKPVNNQKAFEKCNEFLGNGGILFIAPEGGSFVGKTLKKFKTGTSRIALSAMQGHNFELDLCILPIGLVYENPFKFRSKLLVNVGHPIPLKDYKEAYQEDNFAASKMLTQHIYDEMKDLLISPIDDQEAKWIQMLHTLQNNQLDWPLTKSFLWLQKAILSLRNFQTIKPEAFKEWENQLETYFVDLEANGITDYSLVHQKKERLTFLKILLFLLGLPIFLLGIVNHIIPVGLIALSWKRLKIYPTYETTYKFMLGLLLIPTMYYVQFQLLKYWAEAFWSWANLLAAFPSGLFSWWYVEKWKSWNELLKFKKTTTNYPNVIDDLRERRGQLWEKISEITSI